MGINIQDFDHLYSISSIKLDKMKKRQIRRFLLVWGIGNIHNILLIFINDIN